MTSNFKVNKFESIYVVIVLYIYDVPLVEFMYLVFTRMPGESYRRRLRSVVLVLGIWNSN